LVARCNEGDERAWEEFYARYAPKTAAVVKRLGFLGTLNDVEDVVQGVFVNLMKALKTYDPHRPIEAYIIEITRKTAFSMRRRERAQKRGSGNPGVKGDVEARSGAPDITEAKGCGDPEREAIGAQEKELLLGALESLSEKCRELLRRRYSEEQSYAEIAAELHENETTLRVRLRRCLKSLGESYRRAAA
jgi:RNA polymerase sigma-70 factor (ECF subfamily)